MVRVVRQSPSEPLVAPRPSQPETADDHEDLTRSKRPDPDARTRTSQPAARAPWDIIKRALALFALGRVLIVATAFVISAVDHLSPALLLRSWDGKYYTILTHFGYPTTQHLLHAKQDAFFPLVPLLGRLVHDVTRLPWLDSDLAVVWLGGAALVALGALLVNDFFGHDRAATAAVLLAVFPGSVVSGFVYADPVGLAFVAATLLLLGRRRYVVAGLTAFGATLSFSLALAPVLAVCAWLFFVKRERPAFVTGAFAALGAALFYAYLWIHVGTPLVWFRLQRTIWHSRFGVSLSHGTIWALQSNVWAGPVTFLCLAISVAGLVALWKTNAPRTWLVYTGTVFAISMLDTGTWLTPRLVYAMFPGLLALGTQLPRRWLTPAVVFSLVCLVLCVCIYAPQNWVFFNP
jgi:hypothetical protein